MDCWSKGGRKEGQRLTGQGQKNGGKTAANTAAPLLCPPKTTHLLPLSKLGEVAQLWTQVQLHIFAQTTLSLLLLKQ
jgi:hypothetical protein